MKMKNESSRYRCGKPGSALRAARGFAGLVAATLLGGCDVTNPGPVSDDDLNLPAVHQSLVNGSGHQLSRAVGLVGYIGGVAARELMPSGNANDGFTPPVQAGFIQADDVGSHWNLAHSARWIAEDAVRRFTTVIDPTIVNPNVLAEAYLWAGYSNRLLGENFCVAIFDGGPAEPNAKYFERAEAHFTNALASAESASLRHAALAGRASVRLWLKDFSGAESDAQQVPIDFVKVVEADGSNTLVRNYIYFVGANIPYRGYSVWSTWHAAYYTESGDPRTPWVSNPLVPFSSGQIAGYGPIPYWFQQKYRSEDDDYRLSTGREMVLVRAEVLLTRGEWAAAMGLINSLRTGMISEKTGVPLAPWVASSVAEAWTFLKRERNIELWMEARRLGDLRRWSENQTPGEIDWPNYESIAPLFSQYEPSKCYPIPQQELNTNSNL